MLTINANGRNVGNVSHSPTLIRLKFRSIFLLFSVSSAYKSFSQLASDSSASSVLHRTQLSQSHHCYNSSCRPRHHERNKNRTIFYPCCCHCPSNRGRQ